jgi:hypothetical protein
MNAKNLCFIGFFTMARGLLIHRHYRVCRAARQLPEFCHAVCPRRRIVSAGRHQIADFI